MQTYRGSCHCGRVRFEVETELTRVTACNCSICSRKGALMHGVPAERFRLVGGEGELTEYQFNTRTARHFFCRTCGIHPFHRPRTNPDTVSVNVRCLEGIDLEHPTWEVRRFDGQNWEQAAAARRT